MPAIKANDDENIPKRVLKGIFDGYFSHTDSPICFDKSRGWCHHIEMLEEMLEEKVKIIVMVRDVREVLASFESLWRKNAGHRAIPQEKQNYHKFNSVEGRCATWMKENEVVGASYNNIRDAVQRGYEDRLLFVDFDTLTNNPESTMRKVYEFLGEKYYNHDFDNVEQTIHEKDEYYGFDDLHTIRPKVEPVVHKWPILLGHEAPQKYAMLNFWAEPESRNRLGINVVID